MGNRVEPLRSLDAGDRVRLAARLAFGAVIVLATLSPWRFEADPAAALRGLERALHPSLGARDAVDALRNLVLFGGWGAVWLVTSPPHHRWRSVAAATGTGAALSVGVELLQLFSPVRTTSILDVLSNTTGALGGALLLLLLQSVTESLRAERSFVGVPAFLLAGPYLGAVLLEAFVPLFRQEALTRPSGGPLAQLGRALDALEPGALLAFPYLDFLLFLPAGAFAVAALVERGYGYRPAWWRVALGGAALLVAVQLARGVVGHSLEPGALLLHALALALGARAASRWLPGLSVRLRGRERPQLLLLAYLVILALWRWRPFLPELDPSEFAGQLSLERLVPLQSHGVRVDLFSVADLGIQFLLFLPVGALLAVWPLRTQGPWRHLLPALYLAVLLEAGQLLIAARYFDITDMLVPGAGAAVCWMMVRRAGFRPYGELLAPGAELRARPARR